MKKSVKNRSAKRNARGFHYLVLIFILLIGIIGYYWAKTHEQFGLKRFTSFIHPYCMDPLINRQAVLQTTFSGQSWDVFADKDVGIELRTPADWWVSDDCRAHMCASSPDFDGKNGQIVRITRVDKRLEFPFEQFYFGRQPTNSISYLFGQRDCAYVEIGGLHGIRQRDSTPYKRSIYALDADAAAYILTTENFDNDAIGDQNLEAVVSNFRNIPVESKFVGSLDSYTGVPSPMVPDKNIYFEDRDMYERALIQGEFSETKVKGYTFTAFKGDVITFELIVPASINPMPDTRLEVYSYGPSVLQSAGQLEWRVPVTGRYFLVVKDVSNMKDLRAFWLRTRISP